MGKRFITYFGVPVPPFKEEKYSAQSTSIRFILTGTIPSKKNNQQAVTLRQFARQWAYNQQKTGRPATWDDVQAAIGMTSSKMRGNQKYIDFVDKYKPIIQEQMAYWSSRLQDRGLVFPLSKATMTLRFYFKNKYITDTVNKQQTIQDLLVECGVLADDDYRTLNPILSKSGCYYEEIIHDIAFISLTTNLIRPL